MRPGGALRWGLLALWGALVCQQVRGLRHSVYWNSSNPRFFDEDYSVQVSINDYLDIYCPHYERVLAVGGPETFALLMVDLEGYRGCYETQGAFKRWECNRPYAPYGPVRFSEKIQRFTPFSLGFEFQPGHDYYYISIPTSESPGRCLKLLVSVCCKATSKSVCPSIPFTEGNPPKPPSQKKWEIQGGPELVAWMGRRPAFLLPSFHPKWRLHVIGEAVCPGGLAAVEGPPRLRGWSLVLPAKVPVQSFFEWGRPRVRPLKSRC
ncbi:Ephrin-A4 [Varanus komodoensis]|nr:Ephrin-A4 [Varanus komodoensis]